MDAFVTKLSYHATSFAIRSCLALTSKYVAQQAGSLLKTVNDGPLRRQLDTLQRRLARKIELLSPILESIELRYAQGETALEAVIKISQELREDIDALEARIMVAQPSERGDRPVLDPVRNANTAEVLAIIDDLKEVITSIDDAIPLINLWVSSLGTAQPQSAPFSPSRLLQASMLLNIADSQFVLSPSTPMQIGPDFYVSLYMLFRGHASLKSDEEPYGIGEGQRKPLWQQIMRKARVRLYRIPQQISGDDYGALHTTQATAYQYQLQIVEDLDDGLLHTSEERGLNPHSYDGVPAAGRRQTIDIAEVSKLLYTEVGSLLNIVPEDEQQSNPVLLLKRVTQMLTCPQEKAFHHRTFTEKSQQTKLCVDAQEDVESDEDDDDDQGHIDKQLAMESASGCKSPVKCTAHSQSSSPIRSWQLPTNLDPEWIALEMFSPDEDDGVCSDTSSQTADDVNDVQQSARPQIGDMGEDAGTAYIDANLCSQFSRMGMASRSISPRSNTIERRRSSSTNRSAKTTDSRAPEVKQLTRTTAEDHHEPPRDINRRALLRRSPFGAIMTSLSLLEMLLRLTSLQEFEQKTHLAIPDHLLRFYLDESASTSGLHGQQRVAARKEAEAKMGFDPYSDTQGNKGA